MTTMIWILQMYVPPFPDLNIFKALQRPGSWLVETSTVNSRQLRAPTSHYHSSALWQVRDQLNVIAVCRPLSTRFYIP